MIGASGKSAKTFKFVKIPKGTINFRAPATKDKQFKPAVMSLVIRFELLCRNNSSTNDTENSTQDAVFHDEVSATLT